LPYDDNLRPPLRGAAMTHLLNLLCGTFLVYASVTRGGLAVAYGLERLARNPS